MSTTDGGWRADDRAAMAEVDGLGPLQAAEVHAMALDVGEIAVWVWDVADDRVWWSPAWEGLLGSGDDGLPPDLAGSLELVHADDIAPLQVDLAALLDGLAQCRAEYRIRRTDGSYRWVRGSARMLRGDAGDAERLVLVVVDASQEHLERDAADQRSVLEELVRAHSARLINLPSTEVDAAITTGLGELATFLGAELGVLRVDGADGHPDRRFVWGPLDPQLDGATIADLPDQPWTNRQLAAGQTIRVSGRADMEPDAAVDQRVLEELGFEAALVVPLIDGTQTLGAMAFFAAQRTEWPIDGEPLLRAFAGSCLQALLRMSLEDDLRDAHTHLRHLVESGPLLMFDADVSGATLGYVSGNTDRILGYPGDWVAAHWQELLHPDDVPRAEDAIHAAASEGAGQYEARFRHRDGRLLTLDVVMTMQPVGRSQEVRLVGYALDVTQRRESERRLRQAQKLEAVGQLAGGVAHDFNNLLTVIHGHIEVVARRADSPELNEALSAAERARRLVQRLLTFSRQRPAQTTAIDLNATVTDLVAMLRPLTGPDIHVVRDLSPDLPLATADATLLEQAVVNLVVNARDAMPDGGTITFTTRVPRPEDVHDGPAGPVVQLVVSDTGVGMTPDVLSRALEPFYTTKPEGEGTGLGLSTAYGAVTTAGGTMSVESTPGEGTSVTLVLPAATRTGQAQAAADQTVDVTSGDTGGTVLLVEDEPQVRDLLEGMLRRGGYQVIQAENGVQALARAGDQPIDLLLTDVSMPGLKGPDLAAALRRDQPGLRVMYMSGYNREQIDVDSGTAFLAKPFTMKEFFDCLTDVMR